MLLIDVDSVHFHVRRVIIDLITHILPYPRGNESIELSLMMKSFSFSSFQTMVHEDETRLISSLSTLIESKTTSTDFSLLGLDGKASVTNVAVVYSDDDNQMDIPLTFDSAVAFVVHESTTMSVM